MKTAFWTMFILLLVALGVAFFFLGQNITYKSAVDSQRVDFNELMDSKGCSDIKVDCNCEKCPEIDEDFLAFCESLPINQEAVEIPIEPIIDLPIVEPIVEEEPVCIRWNYYFSNEVCEEWK